MEKAQDSYKSRMAQKWGIPVVAMDFIHKCVEAGMLLEADPFVVAGKTATGEFDTGKIVGMCCCCVKELIMSMSVVVVSVSSLCARYS